MTSLTLIYQTMTQQNLQYGWTHARLKIETDFAAYQTIQTTCAAVICFECLSIWLNRSVAELSLWDLWWFQSPFLSLWGAFRSFVFPIAKGLQVLTPSLLLFWGCFCYHLSLSCIFSSLLWLLHSLDWSVDFSVGSPRYVLSDNRFPFKASKSSWWVLWYTRDSISALLSVRWSFIGLNFMRISKFAGIFSIGQKIDGWRFCRHAEKPSL